MTSRSRKTWPPPRSLGCSALEAEGLIHGDTSVDLTAQGEARYESLREYVGGPTVRLLSHFDLGDIETTVRTLQAITRRAADEAAASADQPG